MARAITQYSATERRAFERSRDTVTWWKSRRHYVDVAPMRQVTAKVPGYRGPKSLDMGTRLVKMSIILWMM